MFMYTSLKIPSCSWSWLKILNIVYCVVRVQTIEPRVLYTINLQHEVTEQSICGRNVVVGTRDVK